MIARQCPFLTLDGSEGTLKRCVKPRWHILLHTAHDHRGPCRVAPRGWYCTRSNDHPGPCAAWPRFWRHPIQWLRHPRRTRS